MPRCIQRDVSAITRIMGELHASTRDVHCGMATGARVDAHGTAASFGKGVLGAAAACVGVAIDSSPVRPSKIT